LPKFSSISLSSEFKIVVFDFYQTIIPVFLVILILIFIFKVYIIKFLFTDEFLPTKDLFLWQLLGDFIKVLSMVISFQLLAKKMVWQYLIIESIALINLYVLSVYFIDLHGAKGATIAHTITFLIHFVIILFIFRRLLFSKEIIKI
jgi:PST family polysaccharide transporter